jgi:serine/threonine protein kinase
MMDSTVLILAIAIGILLVLVVALIIALVVQHLRKLREWRPPAPPARDFKPLQPTERFTQNGTAHSASYPSPVHAPPSEGGVATPPPHRPTPPRPAQPSLGNATHEPAIMCIAGRQQGRQAKFATNKITLGRDPKCNFVITDLFVSQHHAEIKLEHGHVTLEDQNSTHGTWLLSAASADASGGTPRQQRVMQAPLTEQMQFRIGDSTFALLLPGRSLPVLKANEARSFIHAHQPVLPFLTDYVLDEADDGEALGPLTVFKARAIKHDPRANANVWVKYLSKPIFADNAFFRAKFEQQIAIGQTIVHPHCARIFDGDSRAAIPYIIEQRLSGGTLADRLRMGQPMGEDEITHVVGQVCNALSYLHKRNIVHQAVTPDNIAFDTENKIYLMHCGFAKLFSEPHVTNLGVFTGDPRYLATEQIRGDAIGLQTDLYALGTIAYQMATGHLPFEAEHEGEIVRKHIEARLHMPRKLNAMLTDYMSLAIMKALDKDPLHRFANAREMAKSFGYTEQFVASKDATGLMFMPRNQAAYPLPSTQDNPYDYRPRPAAALPQNASELRLKNVATGAFVVIAGPRMVITREMIDTKDNMISRTNGQIYQQDGAWHIAELPEAMSANGLFVNNIRVTEPRTLKAGDQIRFGKTTLRVVP